MQTVRDREVEAALHKKMRLHALCDVRAEHLDFLRARGGFLRKRTVIIVRARGCATRGERRAAYLPPARRRDSTARARATARVSRRLRAGVRLDGREHAAVAVAGPFVVDLERVGTVGRGRFIVRDHPVELVKVWIFAHAELITVAGIGPASTRHVRQLGWRTRRAHERRCARASSKVLGALIPATQVFSLFLFRLVLAQVQLVHIEILSPEQASTQVFSLFFVSLSSCTSTVSSYRYT